MPSVLGLTPEVLERARLSRDARFDGRFFIAVKSTRIYCRPICTARVSRESNVRYYATAAEAAEAGFRPCLRCRPEASPGSPAWMGTSAVVQRALRLIQNGALDDESVEEFARRLGIGVRHLNRLFGRHVGASPIAVAQTRRLHFAKRLIDETSLAITDVALASGFRSLRRFNEVFRATYRRPPREMRKRVKPAYRGDSEGPEIVLRLAYRPPYAWEHVHAFLARRAVRGVELAGDGRYARSVRTSEGHAVVQVRPLERANALQVDIYRASPSDLMALLSSVRRVFDLAADPERVTRALRRDSHLGPLVMRWPGLRIAGSWDPFECGVRAIVEHHEGRAAVTMLSRLAEQLGQPVGPTLGGIDRAFPTAAAIAACDLAALGMSQTVGDALQRFARAVAIEASRFDELSESAATTLAQIPTVGSSIGELVALRALGEPDAFPSEDPVLRRQAARDGPPLASRELGALAESWRPFRGYAAFYLWQAAECVSTASKPGTAVGRAKAA